MWSLFFLFLEVRWSVLKLRLAHYAYVVVIMVENGGSPYLLKYQEHNLSHGKIVFFLSSTLKKENIIYLYYFYVAFVKFWWCDIHILIYNVWQIFMLPCNNTTHETERWNLDSVFLNAMGLVLLIFFNVNF